MKVSRITSRRHLKSKGTYKDIETSVKVHARVMSPFVKANNTYIARFAAPIFRVHMEVASIVSDILR
jgi:hypothetical protein